MLSNTNIEFVKAESNFPANLKILSLNKSQDTTHKSDSKKPHSYLQKYLVSHSKIKSRCKYLTANKEDKQNSKVANLASFAPILEENEWVVDDMKETNGPSYLWAIKFASVYNEMESDNHISSEAIQEDKMNKIKAYREYMQNKNTAVSRNECSNSVSALFTKQLSNMY